MAAMPAKRSLEDAQDRAQKHRKVGCVRLKIDFLGFHPSNRGGAGILTYHAHEVAHDMLTNGIKEQRYHNIEVVRVPLKDLEDWRSANLAKCERDQAMPSYSPKMIYACLTGTHLTHALKLGSTGDRTLFNDGKVLIKYEDTEEYHEIRENGVLAVVYDEKLWDDKEALHKLMLNDNLNASIQVGEDEVQAFGRVDRVVLEETEKAEQMQAEINAKTGAQPTKATITLKQVYNRVEAEGFGKFAAPMWTHFIKFRLTITNQAAKIFLACQQQCVGARVAVRSSDYQVVSTLDERCPLMKVAILLHRYHDTLVKETKAQASKATGAQPTGGPTSTHFEGTQRITAPQINAKACSELVEEPGHALKLEGFIVEMFQCYKVTTVARSQGSDLEPRIALLSHVGRAALKTGDALFKLRHTKSTLREEMTQEMRNAEIDLSMRGVFANGEDAYRKNLLEAGAAEGELPEPKHPIAGAQPTKKKL